MSVKEIASELMKARMELAEARMRVPAHGATPSHILQVEELEERIVELERKLSEAGPTL
jgi:ribosomal protein L29